MATATLPARRVPTQGYFSVPNSLIENQALLTRPEMALTLIVLRRSGQESSRSETISDRHWKSWTGLSPRAKEYAEAGLKKKGTILIEGRGQSARYAFSRTGWEGYVRHAERTKPRTEGRRAVDPSPGALVHPSCREQGCAVLRSQHGESGLTVLGATPNAQPVAQSAGFPIHGAHCDGKGRSGKNDRGGQKASSLNLSTPNAQPVAQTNDLAETVWAKALGALRSIFPLVGVNFLVRLLAVVRAMFADVTDNQLADAIAYAWSQKRDTQKKEGLFLLTVPDALAHIRRQRPVVRAGPPGLHEGARRMVQHCIEALSSRGAAFAGEAKQCQLLLQTINCDPQAGFGSAGLEDLQAIGDTMEAIEDQIYSKAWANLDSSKREEINESTALEVRQLGFDSTKHTAEQIIGLTTTIKKARTFRVLSIPRLDLYYA